MGCNFCKSLVLSVSLNDIQRNQVILPVSFNPVTGEDLTIIDK